MKMKLADKIKYELLTSVSSVNSDILVPNFYVNTPYEMDLFKLTKSGYVYEYEIKISRSDFFNDFKKSDTKMKENYKELYKLYRQKKCSHDDLFETKNKHEQLLNGELLSNYFTFVFPEGLLDLNEIPEKYGVMVLNKYGRISGLRAPKRLHGRKFDNYKMLAEKLSYRLSIKEFKLRTTTTKLKDANAKIKKIKNK